MSLLDFQTNSSLVAPDFDQTFIKLPKKKRRVKECPNPVVLHFSGIASVDKLSDCCEQSDSLKLYHYHESVFGTPGRISYIYVHFFHE